MKTARDRQHAALVWATAKEFLDLAEAKIKEVSSEEAKRVWEEVRAKAQSIIDKHSAQ